MGFPVAQLVKNLSAMRETWVWSLGWEDPLEKGKATHSNILAWRIPWTVHHGVTKSLTRLSNIHFHFDHLYFHDYFEFFPVRPGFSMSYLLMREKPSSQLPWLELTAVISDDLSVSLYKNFVIMLRWRYSFMWKFLSFLFLIENQSFKWTGVSEKKHCLIRCPCAWWFQIWGY